MLKKDFSSRFKWLYPHLEEAGRRLRFLQKNKKYKVGLKKDGSKVTDADNDMSHYWMELISKAFPGETIVSEEEDSSHQYPPHSEIIWYIDPIDGTSRFIDGSPDYFVLISICIEGKAMFGLLYQPERNCMLYGNPYIQTRLYTSISEYREFHRVISWKHQLPLIVKGANPSLRSRLEQNTHLTVKRSSVAAHNIVSPLFTPITGFVTFRKTAYWDLAAPEAVMKASGFRAGLLSLGTPVFYNNGNIYGERFYCLPGDTPEEVVDYISTVTL